MDVKTLFAYSFVDMKSTGKASSLPCEIEGWPGSTIDEGPGNVPFVFSIPWKEWEVAGEIDLHEEQIVVSSLTIRAKPKSPFPAGGISAATLRLPLGRIRTDIRRTIIKNIEHWTVELKVTSETLQAENAFLEIALSAAIAASEQTRRGRKPYSEEELRTVARLYLDIQRKQGVARIAEEMALQLDQSVSTVNKKIRRATQAGFLGSAQQGRGGRMPGPLLDANER